MQALPSIYNWFRLFLKYVLPAASRIRGDRTVFVFLSYLLKVLSTFLEINVRVAACSLLSIVFFSIFYIHNFFLSTMLKIGLLLDTIGVKRDMLMFHVERGHFWKKAIS